MYSKKTNRKAVTVPPPPQKKSANGIRTKQYIFCNHISNCNPLCNRHDNELFIFPNRSPFSIKEMSPTLEVIALCHRQYPHTTN